MKSLYFAIYRAIGDEPFADKMGFSRTALEHRARKLVNQSVVAAVVNDDGKTARDCIGQARSIYIKLDDDHRRICCDNIIYGGQK